MDIVRKTRAVETLFKTLEKKLGNLKIKTGLSCPDSCLNCCTTSKIMATELEFYPLGMYLYKTGKAESFLENIEKLNNQSICPLLNYMATETQRLGCIEYEYRGLICRLFGYNFFTNKHGIRLLAACKKIHIEQAENVKLANEILLKKEIGAKASDFYTKLQLIDFHKGSQLYPIGEAIKLAIEAILIYFHYRGKKAV